MSDDPKVSRMLTYLDWVVRGTVAALFAAAIAVARWGLNTEQRIHDLEANTGLVALVERVTKLESKEDGYQQIRTDLAVLQSRQEDATKKMERIEELLLQISRHP